MVLLPNNKSNNILIDSGLYSVPSGFDRQLNFALLNNVQILSAKHDPTNIIFDLYVMQVADFGIFTSVKRFVMALLVYSKNIVESVF